MVVERKSWDCWDFFEDLERSVSNGLGKVIHLLVRISLCPKDRETRFRRFVENAVP